jgi:hypothetical protein
VLVMMSILAMSVAAAALLISQKNSYSVVMKIENQDIQRDVGDFCLKKAVDTLKASALVNNLPTFTSPTIVPVSNSDLFSFFFSTQQLSSAAISSFRQYTANTSVACSYQFVKQRPMTGTTTLSEVTQDRAYQNTGNENVYLINVATCNASSATNCKAARTLTKIYIGIQ